MGETNVFCDQCGDRLDGSFCGGCGVPAPGSAPRTAEVRNEEIESQPTALGLPRASQTGGYPPSAPLPAYQPPQRRVGAGRIAAIAIGVVALAALGFFAATQLNKSDAQPEAVTATGTAAPTGPPTASQGNEPTGGGQVATEPAPTPAAPVPSTTSAPAPSSAKPADQQYAMYLRGSGYGAPFSQAATLTTTTSEAFMQAVASAYAASGAGGGSIVLDGVYSNTTNKSYRMTCLSQPDGFVICSGGRNARVLLFN